MVREWKLTFEYISRMEVYLGLLSFLAFLASYSLLSVVFESVNSVVTRLQLTQIIFTKITIFLFNNTFLSAFFFMSIIILFYGLIYHLLKEDHLLVKAFSVFFFIQAINVLFISFLLAGIIGSLYMPIGRFL
jgi:hypothetical protein